MSNVDGVRYLLLPPLSMERPPFELGQLPFERSGLGSWFLEAGIHFGWGSGILFLRL